MSETAVLARRPTEYLERIDTNEIGVLFNEEPSTLSAKEITRVINGLIDRINEQADRITGLERSNRARSEYEGI